jgi:hypothetical protein
MMGNFGAEWDKEWASIFIMMKTSAKWYFGLWTLAHTHKTPRLGTRNVFFSLAPFHTRESSHFFATSSKGLISLKHYILWVRTGEYLEI